MLNRSLSIGDIVVSTEPMVLGAVLGSCVAVCLFDDVLKIGGMNHFLLPDAVRGINNPLCCADEATEGLLKAILDMGANLRRLRAKVFGGGIVLSDMFYGSQIGERNVTTAKRKLHEYGIPVLWELTGRRNGLKISFHTDTGRAFLKEIKTPFLHHSPGGPQKFSVRAG